MSYETDREKLAGEIFDFLEHKAKKVSYGLLNDVFWKNKQIPLNEALWVLIKTHMISYNESETHFWSN